MGRIFILAIIFSAVTDRYLFAQNLLRNGSFEEINLSDGKPKYYLDTFYAKDWFQPTDCSFDIYRDVKSCDEKHIRNIEPGLDFCVDVADGNYCLGFCTITHYGYMEHVTGCLLEPLLQDEVYKISFDLKFFGDKPYFSKGLGYKFSKEPVVFKSDVLFNKKPSPFYLDLFKDNKVYADFEFKEYLTDSVWNRFTTYYTAKGGERYITFGQFAFKNDAPVRKQLEYLRHHSTQDKLLEFMSDGRCVFIEKIDSVAINRHHEISVNYYLLDDIKVEKITDEATKRREKTCAECIDSDQETARIPNKREITVDPGYVGNLSFELKAMLQPMEKFVIELGKNRQIIIVNNYPARSEMFTEIDYAFECPAKRLKRKTLVYYVEKTNAEEIRDFEKRYKKGIYSKGLFTGLIFSNKK